MDVGPVHAGCSMWRVGVADRVDRDVVRCLHERELGRRLDHAAGVDERLAGDDLAAEAGHRAHVVDDEEARGPLDRERCPAAGYALHRIGNERERTLVLVPGPDVGLDRSDSSTDGTSKNGVTTTVCPDAGISAAVVRSERHQRMPVKYSREEPASTRQGRDLRRAASATGALATRAARSAGVIGMAPRDRFAPVVRGVALRPGPAGHASSAPATAAPRKKRRLSVFIPPRRIARRGRRTPSQRQSTR